MNLSNINRPGLQKEQYTPAKVLGHLAQLVERHTVFTGHDVLHAGGCNTKFVCKIIRCYAIISTAPCNTFWIYRLYTFHNFAIILM